MTGWLYGREDPNSPKIHGVKRLFKYPEHTEHHKALPREKAAYAKMRNVGLRIQEIAIVFGRSTSYVHKALKRLSNYGAVRYDDKRKMPDRARRFGRGFRWAKLIRLWDQWILWALGEGEKPP